MKKTLLFAAIAAMSSMSAFAQYYYIKTAGTTSEYNMNQATGATTLIAGSGGAKTNMLSAATSLPFSNWQFFGSTVTQFKASTSGYITFDVAQTADMTANTGLPNSSAPKNAIFAFWDNLKTDNYSSYSSDIRYWTYGSTGSRVFVVQWRLTREANTPSTSNANVTYFAIRLYEAGGFDIVENYGYGTFSATIGAQNATGTVGTQVAGSPSLGFGGNNGSYDATKSDVYTFIEGTQPVVQGKIIKNQTPGLVSLSAPSATIAVDVTNYGSSALTSAKFNYSINGGAVVTSAVTTSIAGSGGVAMVSHPTAFVPVAADAGSSKTVVAWLSEINGASGPSSDSSTFSIFVNEGISGTKRVLIEEGSGAWCGYCPDGHLRLRDIQAANDKVIGVVHHNSDGMDIADGNTINSTFATGYPYGMVDRVKFSDQAVVGLNRTVWAAKSNIAQNTPTPLNVSIINKTYNTATRALSFDVKVDFVDYAMPGDIRVNAFIVEDAVRGPKISATNTEWNQHCYYSSADPSGGVGGSSHELFNQPDYMYGYYHNHAVRSILAGPWGDASVIPNAPAKGSTYTKTFNYTLPAEVSVTDAQFPSSTGIHTQYQSTLPAAAQNKHYDSKIVALVSYYNADVNKRNVLNVIEVPVSGSVGVAEQASNASISNVVPNPATGLTRVDLNLQQTSTVSVEIVNLVGQKVMDVKNGAFAAGDHSVYFDAANLNNGIYFVTVKSNEGTATHKIVVGN